jgi:YD repeat-containing protein
MDTLDGRWTYEYDDLAQLTHAAFASTSPDIPNQHLTYVYDALGNRVRTIENGATTEYNANKLNQYVHVGNTNYVFDADGNLTQEITPRGTTAYTYSDENRLIRAESPQGTWEYAYDALGNRLAITENGSSIRYVVDPTGLGNVVGEYDSSGNLLAHYDHALGLLSREDAVGNPTYTNGQCGELLCLLAIRYTAPGGQIHSQSVRIRRTVWSYEGRKWVELHEGQVLQFIFGEVLLHGSNWTWRARY